MRFPSHRLRCTLRCPSQQREHLVLEQWLSLLYLSIWKNGPPHASSPARLAAAAVAARQRNVLWGGGASPVSCM